MQILKYDRWPLYHTALEMLFFVILPISLVVVLSVVAYAIIMSTWSILYFLGMLALIGALGAGVDELYHQWKYE